MMTRSHYADRTYATSANKRLWTARTNGAAAASQVAVSEPSATGPGLGTGKADGK
jgi:hypothetical protein